MKILIAGASGFVGKELVSFLRKAGCTVKTLVRKKKDLTDDELSWDPDKDEVNDAALEGFDAFINLAGENIFGRWSEKKKKAIVESRVKSTKLLSKVILRIKNPPHVFINASAVGYYGSRGDVLLTEDSSKGTGFLAHVCEEWEEAAKPIESKGVRLVFTRFGVILSPKGGALGKMLTPFKLGLGGNLGSGKQYMSWISLEEVLGVIYFILKTDKIQGAVNVVAPEIITNETFTKTLGKVLSRPTMMNIPAGVLQFIFGEMGDEMLLASQKVVCDKLIKCGYQFCQPQLELALRQMLQE